MSRLDILPRDAVSSQRMLSSGNSTASVSLGNESTDIVTLNFYKNNLAGITSTIHVDLKRHNSKLINLYKKLCQSVKYPVLIDNSSI